MNFVAYFHEKNGKTAQKYHHRWFYHISLKSKEAVPKPQVWNSLKLKKK
jgi:hypothetical protein